MKVVLLGKSSHAKKRGRPGFPQIRFPFAKLVAKQTQHTSEGTGEAILTPTLLCN